MCPHEYCIIIGTFYFVFFFQAEDGIRYYKVTGVQTCALPILRNMRSIGIDLTPWIRKGLLRFDATRPTFHGLEMHLLRMRSEERRVGKECRSRALKEPQK